MQRYPLLFCLFIMHENGYLGKVVFKGKQVKYPNENDRLLPVNEQFNA